MKRYNVHIHREDGYIISVDAVDEETAKARAVEALESGELSEQYHKHGDTYVSEVEEIILNEQTK